ncbi:MAG: VOC family protein [Alphaproteobacteria bacterium]
MRFAQQHAITDLCFLVESADRAIEFYTNKLGFKLRRRAEGFADFSGAGLTLAVWEAGHMSRTTGVPNRRAAPGARKAIAAVEVSPPARIDEIYAELKAAGVAIQAPPANFPWNARCIYFTDPDDNVWEVYAWLDGGPEAAHTVS